VALSLRPGGEDKTPKRPLDKLSTPDVSKNLGQEGGVQVEKEVLMKRKRGRRTCPELQDVQRNLADGENKNSDWTSVPAG